jgi:hypothetical protein
MLTYAINVTLDGCVDHREGRPDAELHQLATEAAPINALVDSIQDRDGRGWER